MPAALFTSLHPENSFQWYGFTSNKFSGGSPGLPVLLFSALAHTSSLSSTIAAIIPPQGNIRFKLLTSRPKSPTSVLDNILELNIFFRKTIAFCSRSIASLYCILMRFNSSVGSSSSFSSSFVSLLKEKGGKGEGESSLSLGPLIAFFFLASEATSVPKDTRFLFLFVSAVLVVVFLSSFASSFSTRSMTSFSFPTLFPS
mmetsp:Transcript_14595/g.21318  ORF Transcript_14595/g.21318 Transcript_14595/m.21318 type:complete len:200 (-) Transcript_14595:961-1560(-)